MKLSIAIFLTLLTSASFAQNIKKRILVPNNSTETTKGKEAVRGYISAVGQDHRISIYNKFEELVRTPGLLSKFKDTDNQISSYLQTKKLSKTSTTLTLPGLSNTEITFVLSYLVSGDWRSSETYYIYVMKGTSYLYSNTIGPGTDMTQFLSNILSSIVSNAKSSIDAHEKELEAKQFKLSDDYSMDMDTYEELL